MTTGTGFVMNLKVTLIRPFKSWFRIRIWIEYCICVSVLTCFPGMPMPMPMPAEAGQMPSHFDHWPPDVMMTTLSSPEFHVGDMKSSHKSPDDTQGSSLTLDTLSMLSLHSVECGEEMRHCRTESVVGQVWNLSEIEQADQHTRNPIIAEHFQKGQLSCRSNQYDLGSGRTGELGTLKRVLTKTSMMLPSSIVRRASFLWLWNALSQPHSAVLINSVAVTANPTIAAQLFERGGSSCIRWSPPQILLVQL
jgi:hypothetical protein